MDWTRVTIRTTTEGAEIVGGMLMSMGLNASEIEDKDDLMRSQRPEGKWDMIDDAVFARMEDAVKMTLYIPDDSRAAGVLSDIRARIDGMKNEDFGVDMGEMTVETGHVDDQDWAENWKKDYKPFRLGKHFVIRPSWTQWDAQAGDEIIEIDPGLAFGTGTHETTALCVGLVEELVKPGMDVIDIGTGSGILAIAAARMGAKRVLATDLDPMAIDVAVENVKRNAKEGVVELRVGDLLDVVHETADVVIANIIADVICMLAQPVRGLLREGGVFLCSGIAREKQENVLAALAEAGYTNLDVREDGQWCAIAARVK